MLYVTTRNNADVYTAHRALENHRGPDGGLFLPFHAPKFTPEEIAALKEKSCNQTVAMVLNRMFGTKVSGWDVDFAIGRYPVRVTALGHRILMGETWHNPDWNFDRFSKSLMKLLGREEETVAGDWCAIGVRIAVLFGLYGELLRSETIREGEKVDISLVSGEFTSPISAWYARQWGLPIGNIVCCCNENSEIWNLICHGQFRTDLLSVPTSTPQADVTLPADLERLICGCGGSDEVQRYLEICRRGGTYTVSDSLLKKLQDGLFVSVISSHRIESTIPAAYATHGYLMSAYSALAYAGALDYRAKKGAPRQVVVLAEKGPVCDREVICRAMGIPEEKLNVLL